MKGLKRLNGKPVLCISVVLTGMQTVGVITSVGKYNPMDIYKYTPYYFSYSDTFKLSEEKNICVFILDMLDTKWMNETLERYPELYDTLDGFTFYENNMSVFPMTNPTLLNLFTSKKHDDKAYDFYKAWQQVVMTDILKQNGYSIMMLPSIGSTVRVRYEIIDGRFDNLHLYEDVDAEINTSGVVRTMLNLSFGRAAPYSLKGVFFLNSNAQIQSFNNSLYIWDISDDENADIMYPIVTKTGDAKFYERLKEVGLSSNNDNFVFTFAHFDSGHDDTAFGFNDETDKFETVIGNDRIDAIRGSFVILAEYFRQMKELGIYDNSAIIIMADHGDAFAPKPPIVSTLLIKPEYERGELKRDKTSELSHVNFQASIMDIAGLPYSGDFGLSYFDITENQIPQERIFYDSVFGSGKKYIITGNANDFSNWTLVE